MADARAKPPVTLRQSGILRATDNVGAGRRLALPGSKLWLYFGTELRARFIRQRSVESGGPVDE